MHWMPAFAVTSAPFAPAFQDYKRWGLYLTTSLHLVQHPIRKQQRASHRLARIHCLHRVAIFQHLRTVRRGIGAVAGLVIQHPYLVVEFQQTSGSPD